MHHGAEYTVVLIASLALLIGVGTRWLSAKTRFPYTIAMLLLGIGAGLLLKQRAGAESDHGVLALIGHGADLSPDLIIFVFLPALLFESAYSIDVNVFKNNLGAVLLLAVPALVLSTLATGTLMIGLTVDSWAWSWSAALVFGALISATDPVAVVAILRELGVSKRLAVLIEGESLLNDGTAIVVFSMLLAILTGDQAEFDTGEALLRFLWVVSGGVLVGLLLAVLLSTWIEQLFNDPLSEITLTLVLAYLAMIIAEGLLHVSGVMAVVTTGLWMSGTGKTKISPEVSHFLHRFWETLGYIANTLIFFLVGLVIAREVHRITTSDVLLILLAYVGVMVIRFSLTFGFLPLASRFSDGISKGDVAVISWGGLRGAVSLALALMISQNDKVPFELRHQILLVTAGVVLLTIVVNGTTIGALLQRLGYNKPQLSALLVHLGARAQVIDGVVSGVQELSSSPDLRTCRWGEVESELAQRQTALVTQIRDTEAALQQAPDVERTAGVWRRVLGFEREVYWSQFNQGTIGSGAVRRLSREISRQLDTIAHNQFTPPHSRVPDDAERSSPLGRVFGQGGQSFERLARLYDMSRAEARAAQRVLSMLSTLRGADDALIATLRQTYRRYLTLGKERVEDLRSNLPEVASAIETRLAKRIALNLEREGFEHLAHSGSLDETAAHVELEQIDRRMHLLRRGAEWVPIPETADLVAATPLFSGLDQAALRELAELTEEQVLPAGQTLFAEDDRGDSLYVIARGTVRVLKNMDGKNELVDVLGGGEIIGEMSLLTSAPRTATAVTGTAVTLGKLRRDAFMHLMNTQPGLGEKIWREFGWRSFDNLCRADARFSTLTRDERRAWFDAGRSLTLGSGEVLPIADADWLLVISGRVSVGEAASGPGSLVSLVFDALEKPGSAVAEEPSRVVLLGTPRGAK